MRKNYRREFYKLFYKRSLLDVPKIIGIMLIVAIFSSLVILGISSFYSEEEEKINVAYVYEDEEMWFKVGLKNMGRSVNCNFKKYSERAALRALENHEVVAVLIVNDEDGEEFNSNFPISSIKFIHYDEEDFINLAFDDVVHAAIMDFVVLNLNSDVVRTTESEYNRSDLYDLEEDLLQYLMHRNNYYERVQFYDSGDIPLKEFYLGNAVTIIVLLSSAVILGFMKNEDTAFVTFAKRSGIRSIDVFIARYMPTFLVFLILVLLTSVIYQVKVFKKVMPVTLVGIVVATIFLFAITILIHELISDKIASTLISIAASVILMFMSGNIIPLAFLPDRIGVISDFIPTKYASRLLGQMFYGQAHYKTLGVSVIITIVLLAVSYGVFYVRGLNDAKNN